MVAVRVEISGFKELSQIINNLDKKLDNMQSELQQLGSILLKVFRLNFRTEGQTLQKPWEQLAAFTVQERTRQGFSGRHPILKRTGRLERGFKAKVGKQDLVILNVVDYFPQHQLGRPSTNLPQRVMLDLTQKMQGDIIKFVVNIISKAIKG